MQIKTTEKRKLRENVFIRYTSIKLVILSKYGFVCMNDTKQKNNRQSHLLLLKMMLVTFSSSAKESGPIWCISFPVMKTVLAYPGTLCGTASRSLETHFTVRVTAKHSQPEGHSEHRCGVQRRTPRNTRSAKTHISEVKPIKENDTKKPQNKTK